MVTSPFPASFLPRMGNRTFRYSQSGFLGYDCRGFPSISPYPYSNLRALRRRIARSFYQNLNPRVYEERILHG